MMRQDWEPKPGHASNSSTQHISTAYNKDDDDDDLVNKKHPDWSCVFPKMLVQTIKLMPWVS